VHESTGAVSVTRTGSGCLGRGTRT
jgi:hypothetical protein